MSASSAIPLTIEEFPMVQRFLPIVFTVGENSIPIALMGLNEGVNVFVDDEGALLDENFYVPAYVRRYPYMLARLRPDATEFVAVLRSDRRFDRARSPTAIPCLKVASRARRPRTSLPSTNRSRTQASRTGNFMTDLKELDLLMEGRGLDPAGWRRNSLSSTAPFR